MTDNSQCGQSIGVDIADITLEDILTSAGIGALYVDDTLHIRKIMPMIMKYTDLQPEDVGRSVLCVNFIENYPDLKKDLQEVMQAGRTVERELYIKNQCRLLRMYPHLVNGKTCGAVLVLSDITESKSSYFQLEQEKEKLNIIAEMSGDLLFEYDIRKNVMQYTKQSASIINEDEVIENYTETICQRGNIHTTKQYKLQQG